MKLVCPIRSWILTAKITVLFFIISSNVFGQTCTPSTPVCVPANGYAFQFAGDTDYGLLFSLTDEEYQFTNGIGLPLVRIHANNGLMTVENNMLVNGKFGVGLGNPLFADFSVNNALSQFGVASGYVQIDSDGDLNFVGSANFLVGGDKYAFRYSGDEDFGLYFSLSGFAYDFLGDNGVSLFKIGSLSGDISNSGTATIGTITQNDNLDRILVTDPTGLISYRDASTLGGGGGGGPETDPQVGANTLNKVPKWDGSALVTGTISMESTSATGTDASAMGTSSNASGASSTAMGFGTSATSTASTAAGFMSTSSGWASTSLGQLTTATGDMSVASGDNTTASAFSSTASGQNSLATGEVSSAHGKGSKARSYGEFVIGSHNKDYTALSTNSWNSADRLFVIGNGASAGATSNALTVLKNGNIGLGIETPMKKLHIASNNMLLSGSTTSMAGIEIQPKLGTSNSGGRIFFREFNSDNFGMSMGYSGANSDNVYLNWPKESFNIAFHTDNSVGDVALSIPRTSGYVGINTTAPTTELDVDGSVRIRSLAGTGVRQVFADSSGRLINNEVIGSQVNNPNSAIPDNSCTGLSDTLALSGFPDTIQSSDIRVVVNVTHTWLSDLKLYLKAPSGETICLINSDGSNGDNLINTIFTDDGQFLTSGSPPFSGYYIPNGDLGTNCSVTSTVSSFTEIGGGNTNPNGEWILYAYDNAVNTSGTLKDWQIFITGSNSGRNNYMIKWQDGNLSQQSSIYDNGRIGIGTEDPSAKVEIEASDPGINLSNVAALKAVGLYGPTNGYLGVQGADDFDGIPEVDILDTEIGVLGISAGQSVVDNYGVWGISNQWGGRFSNTLSSNVTYLGGEFDAMRTEGSVVVVKDGIGITQESADGLTQVGFYAGPFGAWLQTHSNHDLNFSTNDGSRQAVLTTSGNFGIGPSLPSNRLSVEGDANVTGSVGVGTSTPGARVDAQGGIRSSNGGDYIEIYRNSGNAEIKTNNTEPIYFQDGTGGNVYFTGGNVGIGTSSTSEKLTVNGGVNASKFVSLFGGGHVKINENQGRISIEKGCYGGSENVIYGNVYSCSSNFAWMRFDRSSAFPDRFLVTQGGDLTIAGNGFKPGGGSWAVGSDKRLKRDIKPFSHGLETLMKINPISFKYNGKAGIDYDHETVGVIAQEIEEIAPYTIGSWTGADDISYLSFDPNALWYISINAIKEQQAHIGTLESAIEILESNTNDEWESRLKELEAVTNNLVRNIELKDSLIHGMQKKLNQLDISLDECCVNHQSEEIYINSDKASLGQNIPNPFDRSTIIPYYIPERSQSALIVITTMDGKEINRYTIETYGLGKVSFNATDLAADSYMYSLFVDGEIIDSRIMIIQ